MGINFLIEFMKISEVTKDLPMREEPRHLLGKNTTIDIKNLKNSHLRSHSIKNMLLRHYDI